MGILLGDLCSINLEHLISCVIPVTLNCMVTYTYKLFLTVNGSSLSPSDYAIDLTEEEESNPNNKLGEQRESIKNIFQQRTSRCLNDEHLELIIKAWLQDIKEGYRDTTLALDLPLLIEQEANNLEASNYPQIPVVFPPHSNENQPILIPSQINEDVSSLIPAYINEDLPELVPPDIKDIEPTIGALPPLNF